MSESSPAHGQDWDASPLQLACAGCNCPGPGGPLSMQRKGQLTGEHLPGSLTMASITRMREGSTPWTDLGGGKIPRE
jgi:hypothetical protein